MQVSVLEKKEATLPEYEQKRVVKEYLTELLNKNLEEREYFDTEEGHKDSATVVRKWEHFSTESKCDIVRFATEAESELYLAINLIRAEIKKSEK